MIRQTHTVKATITDVAGGAAFILRGASAVFVVELTGTKEVLDAAKGPVVVNGKLTKLVKDGTDLLPLFERILGKPAAFKGNFVLPGNGPFEYSGKGFKVTGIWGVEPFINTSIIGDLVCYFTTLDIMPWVRVLEGEGTTELIGWEEVVEPDPPQPVPSNSIRGLMLTDAACDVELTTARTVEYAALRKAYNTVLTLVDLQKPIPGTGPFNANVNLRPYVDWARNFSTLTPLGERNLNWIIDQGFDLHVQLLNTWAASNGASELCGSVQRYVPEAQLYSEAQLQVELAFVKDLLAKVPRVKGFVMMIEALHPNAIDFAVKYAAGIRALGFKGVVANNLLGQAASQGNSVMKANGIWVATSMNNPATWNTNTVNDIRNSDGMMVLSGARHDLITQLTGNPGPQGFYIWASDLVGNKNGRSAIPRSYIDYAVIPQPEPGPGPTPDAPFKVEDLAQEFLWKPKAESSNRCAILLPSKMTGKATYAVLRASVTGPVIAEPNQTGVYNGNRMHSWLPNVGGSYPDGSYVTSDAGGYRYAWRIAETSARSGEGKIIPTVTHL